MRILNIKVDGLPLFKGPQELCFFAKQRVSENDKERLLPVFDTVYTQGATAFIGINASGKTSILKVILVALGLLNNEPLNHIEGREVLRKAGNAIFDIVFYSDTQKLCRLKSEIGTRKTKTGDYECYIKAEQLWEKGIDKKLLKKNITAFSDDDFVAYRRNDEAFLPDDVSFVIARNKNARENIDIASLLSMTNINVLPYSENIPSEVVEFLDPSIQRLYFERINDKPLIHLQFKGKEEIILNSSDELENYLSSGTIKGIVAFSLAKNTLQSGGYLIIDEIENHFNHEIVSTLMRFFMDSSFNKNNGSLIFSTHYPELLDEYDRNDGIYIVRNRNGISVESLTEILKRNDVKKSDAYESGLLDGTTPAYAAYMKLKKSLAKAIQ